MEALSALRAVALSRRGSQPDRRSFDTDESGDAANLWGIPRLPTLIPFAHLICTLALAQQPRIDAVIPGEGPIGGGTLVTIRGANLEGAAIFVDRRPVSPLRRSDRDVEIRMPPHDGGYAQIVATRDAGAAFGEYRYVPPALHEIAPGTITTIAGAGAFAGDGRPATDAMVDPTNLAYDGDDLYILEANASRIRRVRADGRIETFAGNGADGWSPDGTDVSNAPLMNPRGIVVDAESVIIAESFTHRVRRIDKRTRVITTIAGTSRPGPAGGFSGDGGPARSAELHFPIQVALDAEGNLFILDSGNQRIRKVARDGTIVTVAGNGVAGYAGDGGPALAASFRFTFVDVGGLAIDAAGNLLIADSDNDRIRKIDRRTQVITTFAEVSQVRAVTTDANGDVYFARLQGFGITPRIFRADPAGRILESWGIGGGFTENGADARTAALGFIERVVVDRSGNILFTDMTAGRVRRIHRATAALETVAGMGPSLIGETGPATAAVLRSYNCSLALRGRSLIVGDGASRLRAVDEQGMIRTIAGRGLFGGQHPDVQRAAQANEVTAVGMTVERSGELLFCDTHSVWRIDAAGTLRRIAGEPGRFDLSGDGGPALRAEVNQPWDVTSAVDGSIYLADTNNNRIRRIGPDGIITTVAGSGPPNGFERYGHGTTCGDGGPALAACINTPYGLAFDAAGNLYVSENWERIRRISPDGRITTLATVYATKLAIDSVGRLYAVSADGVVRIDAGGTIERLAGAAGRVEPLGDGLRATDASIYAQGQASGIVIDEEGNIIFSDGGHGRIRAIRYGAVLAPQDVRVEATARGTALVIRVSDRVGAPARGVRVDVEVPSAGPSCTPSARFLITGTDGVATLTCTPNCIAGSFEIRVRPAGSTASAAVTATSSGRCRRRGVRH